jgi:anthranilate phosphoribosyltransferase
VLADLAVVATCSGRTPSRRIEGRTGDQNSALTWAAVALQSNGWCRALKHGNGSSTGAQGSTGVLYRVGAVARTPRPKR